jgi:EmrB/QacA subfamily drug resistance transporter
MTHLDALRRKQQREEEGKISNHYVQFRGRRKDQTIPDNRSIHPIKKIAITPKAIRPGTVKFGISGFAMLICEHADIQTALDWPFRPHASQPPRRSERVLNFLRQSAIPLLVAGAFFMENLDGTVIVTALPTMARVFGVSVTDMSVGVSVYLLALAMLIPASGWVADRFGTRRTFAFAIFLFTLSSIGCALSPSLLTFCIARLVQGAAGAMMVPVGRLAVLRNTPKPELINAIATITWPGLAAPILGPPVGGFIVTHASWHWIFLLNVPLGIVGLYLALRLIPAGDHDMHRPFDWPGFLLTGAACVATMAGVEWIGQGRDGATGWTLLATGLVIGIAAYRHARRNDQALLDLWALRLPTFAATVRSGSLFRMAVSSMPFLLPLLLQVGIGFNPFHAGLLMLVLFAGNLAMKPFTTAILRRFRFRTVLLYNGLLIAVTFALCAFITEATPVTASAVLFFVAGLARSMQFTAFNTLAFADVPPERMGGANPLFNTMFQLTMGMGIALGALCLRLAGWGSHAVPTVGDFRIAFLLMGAICLISLVEMSRLPSSAGDAVWHK